MFTILLDSNSPVSLYEQIYHYLKQEIQTGRLSCGTKLPSTRNLASHLSVSRNTVDMAYGQLLSEGYIESFPKRGYFVNEIKCLTQICSANNQKNAKPMLDSSMYQYDFSPFAVDLAHFPYHTWRQLSKNCFKEDTDLFLLGENQGDDALRDAIASYLHQSRAVHCSKEQIIVGAGVDYLLKLLSSILGPNQNIAMENPTYKRAYQIFQESGYTITPIPLDESGMKVSELNTTNCNISYVTPSHQYPLGIIMPIKRRMELLEWAYSNQDHYIIEDDHDSEFRYKGKPIPSLQGIDLKEKVIYIGTFSKAIAPAIRVGYIVLPQKLLQRYREKVGFYSCTVSRIDQAIITEFITNGYFERHLNRMRKIYKMKHDLLLSYLKPYKSKLRIYGENAGLHLVVELNTKESEQEILNKAKQNQIKLYGLSEHFIVIPPDYKPTFLIGYANLPETDIKDGIKKLLENLF
ncbi:MocR-like pyridoxine biosynthesis transcription factor PdxR [Velocimicrobium porci]|uniref:PLP-dependent aminotransferase family protein n=1 Tax=Velocimicrobium porci TaxID=2606634 RepID=A0A6L5XX63_9FIRM|nr:PLP-dependent aminotransferase family protein [Velocimicrobium porci]MSS63335.1 PLP-dependent aminotransferase family protein [Velocimicrobium porci]